MYYSIAMQYVLFFLRLYVVYAFYDLVYIFFYVSIALYGL